MYTILDQSDNGKKLRSFRSYRWRSSNQLSNTLTETFWNVRSQFRQFTFIEYMKLRHLLSYCSLVESRCLYDAPGVLKDGLYLDALRAWRSDVPRKLLWQRLAQLQRLLQRPVWSPNLYYTYNNCVMYEIEEVRRSIRKVKKYSGYVRNSSAVGSKRPSGLSTPVPERFEWNSYEEYDYYHFLTVGEFDSGRRIVIIHPEEN